MSSEEEMRKYVSMKMYVSTLHLIAGVGLMIVSILSLQDGKMFASVFNGVIGTFLLISAGWKYWSITK